MTSPLERAAERRRREAEDGARAMWNEMTARFRETTFEQQMEVSGAIAQGVDFDSLSDWLQVMFLKVWKALP